MLAISDPAVTPRQPSADVLKERIEQLESKADDSSQRLHIEIEELKRRIDALAVLQSDTAARQARADATPIDADKIRFTPRVVIAVVTACVSIVVGMYAVTYGVRSDVSTIRTTMEKQREIDAAKETLAAEKQKLADERLQSLRDAVGVIDKRQQLQQIETQELKEMVLKQGVK